MSFEYLEPDALDEAIALLADDSREAVALAGGTSFALLLRQGLVKPDLVVGLRRIAELQGMRADGDGLWIGAMATHRDVETSPVVCAVHPVLSAAFSAIATIRIRNQGTIGGNLAHADPAQDPPPVLIALGATAHLAGLGGSRRTVPLDEFFADFFTTVLRPDEILLGVSVPRAPSGMRTVYRKFLPGSADDYATVSVATSVAMEADGRVGSVRIALGGVGSVPIRARAAEDILLGALPERHTLDDACDAVREAVEPLDDARGSATYKREMASVWTRRALVEAMA